ncbi:MAG: hypothetical protein HRU11_09755 [Parvularculaceae bacterium]|nr:hypothetical protein [Parvularculaceae bacterium]
MHGDIDERVPQGGAKLLTVFALPGAVLGFLFWLAVEAVEAGGSEPSRLWLGLAMALVVGAAIYTLSVSRGQILKATTAALGLAVFTGIMFALAQGGQGAAMSEEVIPVAANMVILVVALPFLRSAFRGFTPTDYPPLYADAWNIPAIIGIAGGFTLAGHLLALLVGALFQFIGLGFVREMMTEAWFLLPYSGMLAAVGIGVIRQREAAVLSARSIKMALLRVTAPVFALCVTIFVVAVMLRGFGSLIGDLSPVGTLTAAGIVSLIMINAIVGEAGRPEGVLFGATGRLLAVVLLFLMSLAVYGLAMRVMGEGWTPPRIAAAVAIFVTALYAPIYAAAGLTEQWVILRQGNIAISALLVIIAVLVQTPAFRPYDWSVASQVGIIEADPEGATTADLAFIRSQLGEPGEAAFEALSNDPRFAEIANLTPQTDRWRFEERVGAANRALEEGRLRVHPEGSDLPPASLLMLDRLLRDPDLEAVLVVASETDLWLLAPDYLLADDGMNLLTMTHLFNEGRAFSARSRAELSFGSAAAAQQALDALAENGLLLEERTFRLPVLMGQPVIVDSGVLEPYEVQAPAEPAPPLTPTDPLGPETEAPR